MKADKRYWQTADKSRLVEEGDPEARFLFATEGDEISDEDVKRYGLTVKRPKADAADLAEPKAKNAPENKVRSTPENKSE